MQLKEISFQFTMLSMLLSHLYQYALKKKKTCLKTPITLSYDLFKQFFLWKQMGFYAFFAMVVFNICSFIHTNESGLWMDSFSQ